MERAGSKGSLEKGNPKGSCVPGGGGLWTEGIVGACHKGSRCCRNVVSGAVKWEREEGRMQEKVETVLHGGSCWDLERQLC